MCGAEPRVELRLYGWGLVRGARRVLGQLVGLSEEEGMRQPREEEERLEGQEQWRGQEGARRE